MICCNETLLHGTISHGLQGRAQLKGCCARPSDLICSANKTGRWCHVVGCSYISYKYLVLKRMIQMQVKSTVCQLAEIGIEAAT